MRTTSVSIFLVLCWLLPSPASAAAAASNDALAHYAAQVLETAYPDANAPGAAVLVARGDEVLFRDARGMASVELGVPLSADHVFRLGSITKQVAAAGVLKLVEEGKVSLDDPLSKFLPEYPDGDAISVRMLLDHTSGIRSYTSIPGVMDGPIQRDLSTGQLIDSFKDERADFAPGEEWSYNNSGYVLVGAVIEQASGQPWHAYLGQALFEPLDMAHTGYGDQAQVLIPGHVTGYTKGADGTVRARYLSMTQPHAAGALVSKVDDMLLWNRALHGDGLLQPSSHAAMVELVGKAGESNYGFGIVVGELRGQTLYEHGGGIFGFSTHLMYLPDSELTVVVLQNTDSGTAGFQPGETARRLAAFALGEPYPDAVAVEVDPDSLRSAEGVYRIDDDSARVLRVVDGKLTSKRTGGPRFDLIPVAEDDYVYQDSLTRMRIERDETGDAVAMLFQADGDGEFERVARTDEPMSPARARIELPREAREQLVGSYVGPGMTMRVFLEDESIMIQLAGQPSVEVFAESARVLYPNVVEATLEFMPEEGQARSLLLKQGGAMIPFARED
ncbi:MAG: serine hydrolase domain-containing protein [Luteimonas sp.]